MKRLLPIYISALLLFIATLNLAAQKSMGTDFWTGYGYIVNMKNASTLASAPSMSIFVTAGATTAMVSIDIPSMPEAGFSRIINVSPNSTTEVTGFPIGSSTDPYNGTNLPDTRLYYTGISNRAIHITSTAPVNVVQQIYSSNNTSASTALLPTNVWGNNYTVQAIGGNSNQSNPNSFFFVIAKDDNTEIKFTPSCDIVDSSTATIFTSNHNSTNVKFHSGISYTILLNRGQIFNAMGFIQGTIGLDVSGTQISTTDPLKKIAVFGGNGRIIINASSCGNSAGSDNIFQQTVPTYFWGTKYLTVPIKTMEYGNYRIFVSDSNTNVSVNGSILLKSDLKNHSYYEISNNKYNLIESDKRVMITGYIVTPGCPTNTSGNNGSGDPEMINILPVKYGINNTALYTPKFTVTGSGGASYINIIIKKEGIASFKLDYLSNVDTGSSSYNGIAYGSSASIPLANAFKPHPGDTSYYFAKFKVATGATHILKSDSIFSALVYTLNVGESSAYNAGFNFNLPQTYKYTGTGNWSNATNWQNNIIPPNPLTTGSEIIISGKCTLDVPQVIEDGARLLIQPGEGLIINDNLIIQQ